MFAHPPLVPGLVVVIVIVNHFELLLLYLLLFGLSLSEILDQDVVAAGIRARDNADQAGANNGPSQLWLVVILTLRLPEIELVWRDLLFISWLHNAIIDYLLRHLVMVIRILYLYLVLRWRNAVVELRCFVLGHVGHGSLVEENGRRYLAHGEYDAFASSIGPHVAHRLILPSEPVVEV